ncbi:MAG: co-chaperone GroES family protein [Marinilabiliales bacterium]
MTISIDNNDIDKFILVGDRILIKPKSNNDRTKSGLYLPPGIQEKEMLHSGYIVKVGPGYPIPALVENDEFWKNDKNEVKYIPLQAKPGDLAIYLHKSGYEIEFNKEKYIILPQSAILMLIRDEDLFR